MRGAQSRQRSGDARRSVPNLVRMIDGTSEPQVTCRLRGVDGEKACVSGRGRSDVVIYREELARFRMEDGQVSASTDAGHGRSATNATNAAATIASTAFPPAEMTSIPAWASRRSP